MTSRLPAYRTYRDSGVEWIGSVPENWIVLATARVSDLTTGESDTQDSVEDGGYPFFVRSQTVERINSYSFDGEAVLTSGDGAGVGKIFHHYVGKLEFHQRVYLFHNFRRITGRFFFYFFREHLHLVALAGNAKSTVDSLRRPMLRMFPVCLPSVQEQTRIVEFLDYETAKIDALIEKQQQLIELLKEKRQAVITHTVTKGLNPNAPMRDSGVEWLGKVPAHWKVHSLRYCAADGYKQFTDGDWVESPFITDSGVRLLQTGNVGIGEFKEQGFRYISEESFKHLNCTEIYPNNVMICRLDGPVGRACLVPDLRVKMITSVDNAILKTSDKFDPRFLVYMMTSSQWISWIENICRAGGGFRFRVSRTMLGNQLVPAPPIEEQTHIADLLDQGKEMHMRLIARAEEAIALLQERRTALISAAVTGKIDVRGWKPPVAEADAEVA